MIEVATQGPEGRGTRLTLRPPRALNGRQFVTLFVACTGLMWVAAILGWLAGNAFAPVFAVLYGGLVGLALRAAWRAGERDEVIAIAPELVEVWRRAQRGAAFRAHPYWVRLGIGGDACITLSCSGRRVEVGSLLGPAERQELARQLRVSLAAALRS